MRSVCISARTLCMSAHGATVDGITDAHLGREHCELLADSDIMAFCKGGPLVVGFGSMARASAAPRTRSSGSRHAAILVAVTAPSVHQMLIILERRGFLGRTPGRAPRLDVLVAPARRSSLAASGAAMVTLLWRRSRGLGPMASAGCPLVVSLR